MHRIDSRTREKLWSLQETVAGQLSGLLAEVAAEAEPAEQANERFADAVKLTGMKFTRQARLILSKASFPEKSPCARCQQNCSHRPDARLIARERLWLEVAWGDLCGFQQVRLSTQMGRQVSSGLLGMGIC